MNSILAWKEFLEDACLTPEATNAYLNYAYPLIKNHFPVIFELRHLSELLGINIPTLSAMIASPSHFYREFTIPKRSGGTRKISSPYSSLLFCQKWILRNILDRVETHENCHGFKAGRSILSNATVHKNAKSVLNIDIENYFNSIPLSWIINTFKLMGYADNVSYYLAALCCKDGCLAQGAATSPALSNIVSKNMDNRLTKLTAAFNLKYTRYADDITISGNYVPLNIFPIIREIVEGEGFFLNQKKTKNFHSQGFARVTGLVIANGTVLIPRKIKREIKQASHFIAKHGLIGHLNNKKINDPSYPYRLLGKINFWLQIEPKSLDALKCKNIIKTALINV